jgi:hypothetical protein
MLRSWSEAVDVVIGLSSLHEPWTSFHYLVSSEKKKSVENFLSLADNPSLREDLASLFRL